MSDFELLTTCCRILDGNAKAAIIANACNVRDMTDAEASAVYGIATAAQQDMALAARMPATTLIGCRAKAKVLTCIDNDALAASLYIDILANISDGGS